MLRYFVAGNFWLAFAVLLLLGRQVERGNPTRYSVFEFGFMTPETYWFGVVVALVAALGCVAAWTRTMTKDDETAGT